MRAHLLLCGWLLAHAAPAPAQQEASPPAPAPAPAPRWRLVGAWVAVAPNDGFPTRVGTSHRRQILVGARWERALGPARRVMLFHLFHTMDAIPVVLSTDTPVRYDCAAGVPGGGEIPTCPDWVRHRGTVFGFGIAPGGIELRLAAARALQLTAGASAGVLFFTRPMPDPIGARLNFSFDGTVGLRVASRGRHVWVAGYRFQHVSNAGLGRWNPGLNTHMIQLGILGP